MKGYYRYIYLSFFYFLRNCSDIDLICEPAYIELTSLRTALFWVITQRVVVISYRRFGKIYPSYLQGLLDSEPLKLGLDRLSRYVCNKLSLLTA
jgi:hypothetical protein